MAYGKIKTEGVKEMLNEIIHGDCKTILRTLKEKADLVVTDPPYKITKTSGSATSSSLGHKWSGNIKACDKTAGIVNDISFDEWLPLVYDVMGKEAHIYIFVNDKNLNDLLNSAKVCGFRLHNILVWKKNNCTPNRFYMKNCEFIAFLYKGKANPINDYSSSQFLEYTNISGHNKLHPTEKPIPLLEKLISNSSNENQIVLDPFAGSGSTLKAAINLGRNYIGIEIDEEHVKTAEKRVSSIQDGFQMVLNF